MSKKSVLAVDLGAESGRVMAVHFDGRTLELEELHRFPNKPVNAGSVLYWDFLRLWGEIRAGIEKGRRLKPASIGVDTWGVDFGLLDIQGNLIGNPVHYRDSRTEGMMDRAFARVSRPDIFSQTGIQFMPINTLYQLLSLVEGNSPQLKIAGTFLTVPDLINHWLTGAKVCEFSNATTTQLLNPTSGTWATNLMAMLDIPRHIFPEIVQPGTRVGRYEDIPVIAPACHDTGSAVAAVPARTKAFAYISSGTWSLVGVEIDEPILTAAALAANVTNEGGVYGTYRLLKNVMGLWILQQCRTQWAREGDSLSYDELVKMALKAPAFQNLINPNDTRFLPPGNHPQRIINICQQTGQPVPQSRGAIVRCVLESLALAYRAVIEQVSALAECQVTTIHIVGGGAQNELLNQMTANATGLPVLAGPVEATVLGNTLVQLITLGEIAGLTQARQMVSESEELIHYEPQNMKLWQEAYSRYTKLI